MTDNDDRVFFAALVRPKTCITSEKTTEKKSFSTFREAIKDNDFDKVKKVFEAEKIKNSTLFYQCLNCYNFIISYIPFLKKYSYKIELAEKTLINSKDERGKSVLHFINSGENPKEESILKFLLDNKADPNAADIYGTTPLLQLNPRNAPLNVVKLLLDNKADPNKADNEGTTALHKMTMYSYLNIENINLLMEKFANPNLSNNNGVTPFHIAVTSETLDVIKNLLDNNADPNLPDNSGVTPLHNVIKFGSNKKEKIKILCDHNADPNKADNEGNTALHTAAATRFMSSAVYKSLLENNADLTLVNLQQQSPFNLFLDNVSKSRIVNLPAFHISRIECLDIIKECMMYKAYVPEDKEDFVIELFGSVESYDDFKSSISHPNKSPATNT